MNYYILGSKENAEKISAAFKEKGYSPEGWTLDGGLYYTCDESDKVQLATRPCIIEIIKTHPDYQELPLPVESKAKFKVGDRLKRKNNGTIWTIVAVSKRKDFYYLTSDLILDVALFTELDEYELVEPKPKFAVGDIIVSKENQDIKYKILEVDIPNKAGGHDYRLELLSTEFKGAKRYISAEKVDSWGELIASMCDFRPKPKFKVGAIVVWCGGLHRIQAVQEGNDGPEYMVGEGLKGQKYWASEDQLVAADHRDEIRILRRG